MFWFLFFFSSLFFFSFTYHNSLSHEYFYVPYNWRFLSDPVYQKKKIVPFLMSFQKRRRHFKFQEIIFLTLSKKIKRVNLYRKSIYSSSLNNEGLFLKKIIKTHPRGQHCFIFKFFSGMKKFPFHRGLYYYYRFLCHASKAVTKKKRSEVEGKEIKRKGGKYADVRERFWRIQWRRRQEAVAVLMGSEWK